METAYIACVDGSARQQENTPRIFAEMFREVKYKRVIELGTGTGAFTYFLAASSQSTQVFSFDIDTPEHLTKIRSIGVQFIYANVFEYEQPIASLIAGSGRTLLLCDGGDKAREVKTFAKYLKVDDVIMAHDYALSKEAFHVHHYWRSLELVYEDVRVTCEQENLQPFWPNRMLSVGWLSRIKAESHGDGIHT